MPYYQDPYSSRNGQPINYYGGSIDQTPQSSQPSSYPDWWPGSNPRPQSQQIQPSTLPGRFVSDEKDISPREIPMDNSVAVFPYEDFSIILLKKWENNGTITTVPYEPKISQQKGPTPEQQFQTDVQQRLGKLEDMLGVLMNIWQPAPNENKEEKK